MQGIEKLKAARSKGSQGRLESFFKITPAAGGAAPKRKVRGLLSLVSIECGAKRGLENRFLDVAGADDV